MEYIDELTIPHSVNVVEAQRGVWLSGPTCIRHEVVGESHNPEQMRAILARLQGHTNALLAAWLVPESNNVHDPTPSSSGCSEGASGTFREHSQRAGARFCIGCTSDTAVTWRARLCSIRPAPTVVSSESRYGCQLSPSPPALPPRRQQPAPVYAPPPVRRLLKPLPPSVSQVKVVEAMAKPP